MTTGIYKILNKVNGKFYIGSAVDIENRWRRHKHDLNKNNHHNIYLQKAWNKYWNVSFEFTIIEACDKENLLIREQFWLDWAKPEYNLSPTAGNSLGVKHSEQSRKRMSEAKKKMTEETKDMMRQARKGKKLSEEHKAKISKGNKGRVHSEETKAKIGKANSGRIASEETRKKISAGNKNLGTKRGRYKTKSSQELFKNLTAPPIGY